MMEEKNIWTIGHSTHSLEEFVQLLEPFKITQVVDIRNYPGSKRFPHFNKEALELTLPQQGIGYIHLKDLGGRRIPLPGSVNSAWKNLAFRGYADYMETDNFKNAIKQIENIATKKTYCLYVLRSSLVVLPPIISFRLP